MKIIKFFAPLLAIAVFTVGSFFAVEGRLNGKGEEAVSRELVLVLWHVDTFEGGTGSRQDFLMKSAIAFEKKNKGVYVSVIKHTEDSVKESFNRGVFPDMISFSHGVVGVPEVAKPLKTRVNNCFFNSARVGKSLIGYPYAYGIYIEFTNPNAKKQGSVISSGRWNLPLFALKNAGGELGQTKPPIEAYTDFVSGRSSKLVGTQRDLYRLKRRGFEFEYEQIGDVTDLVQYISVTAEDERRTELAKQFAEYLISDEAQARLGEIGLFSPTGKRVEYGEQEMNFLPSVKIVGTLSVLTDEQRLRELKETDGSGKNFEKFKNYISY